MINRGDIKLAIDMVVNAQDDNLFGGEAEYVINTLENCGNEITNLREQVAAQASEIESLRISYDAACMLVAQMHEAAMGEVIGPYHGVVEDVRTKVAAQAAVIEKFKRAIGDWDRAETPSELQSAESGLLKALAIPTDSTQILDKVRRAEREKCAKVCESHPDPEYTAVHLECARRILEME